MNPINNERIISLMKQRQMDVSSMAWLMSWTKTRLMSRLNGSTPWKIGELILVTDVLKAPIEVAFKEQMINEPENRRFKNDRNWR